MRPGRDGAGLFVNIAVGGTGSANGAFVVLTNVTTSFNKIVASCGAGIGGGGGICLYIGSFKGSVLNAHAWLDGIVVEGNRVSSMSPTMPPLPRPRTHFIPKIPTSGHSGVHAHFHALSDVHATPGTTVAC